jgi:cell division protein FtsA
MAMKDEVIVGVDVGTTKVVAIIAEENGGVLEIGGVGTAPSSGIKNGAVINMDSTAESIRKAVHEAELMAGRTVDRVVVSISGNQIRGFNSHGQVAVPHREVREDDVRRVIEAAQATKIPEDRQLIHTLPQGYIVDSNDVKNHKPVGMAGVRLEAKVHIVTCAKSSADNLMTCCNRNNLSVSGLVFSGLSASESVLTEDEKELGVAVADIGSGTTDIVIWHGNAVIHTASIPVAGELITNDVAQCLRTPRREAEKIKVTHGCAFRCQVDDSEEIEVPGMGGRTPVKHKRQFLCDIIEPRVEEIMWGINEQLELSGFRDMLSAGLVITGGTANLPGIADLAEANLNMPVRVGQPNTAKFGGLVDIVRGPAYSGVLGLVSWCSGNMVLPSGQKRVMEKKNGVLGFISSWVKNAYGQN